nr:MAG TPA: hypothetical protein [Caudoviricetes sp.]
MEAPNSEPRRKSRDDGLILLNHSRTAREKTLSTGKGMICSSPLPQIKAGYYLIDNSLLI